MSPGSPQPNIERIPEDRRSSALPQDGVTELGAAALGQQMTQIERLLDPRGSFVGWPDALATLQRWQLDASLDGTFRDKADALVWRFQPNGWDEV